MVIRPLYWESSIFNTRFAEIAAATSLNGIGFSWVLVRRARPLATIIATTRRTRLSRPYLCFLKKSRIWVTDCFMEGPHNNKASLVICYMVPCNRGYDANNLLIFNYKIMIYIYERFKIEMELYPLMM